jgi:DNA repair photolyase
MSVMRWKLVGESPQGRLFPDVDEVLERRPGEGQFAGMEFLHVRARRIINEVPSASRMPFRWTINAYRGCQHACTYCFARPTHEYLGLDAGADFERRIVVKVNAVERLRAELAAPRWRGDHIALGTNTDPYQRCEGRYRLTRGVIEVLAAAANPFSILTKSTLILRDLDLLADAAGRTDVRANLRIVTLDDDVWRRTEAGTPHPRRRVEAVARLNEAGVPCGVLVAPILPGLSDRSDQLEAVVAACLDAGAVSVSPVTLHLRPGVREVFMPWLTAEHPDLAADYRRLYRGAYAPRDVQDRIAGAVRRAAAAHRRGAGAPARRRPAPPADQDPQTPAAAPTGTQRGRGLQ